MRLLILGDIHIPAHDPKIFDKLRLIMKMYKPEKIIQLGDIVDFKAWSRFQKNPEDDSPNREWIKVKKALDKLHEIIPNMTIIQGNHDNRISKKAIEAGIPESLIRSLSDVFNYDGWTWTKDKPLVIDNIAIIHGDEQAGTVSQKAKALGMNVIQGHTHQASLSWIRTFNKYFFAVEAGSLLDRNSPAFNYASSFVNKSFNCVVLIEEGVPNIIPLENF
jgi:predicted phosphodiesterase